MTGLIAFVQQLLCWQNAKGQKKTRFCPICRRPVVKKNHLPKTSFGGCMEDISQKTYDCGCHYGPFNHTLKHPFSEKTIGGDERERIVPIILRKDGEDLCLRHVPTSRK